MTLIIDMMLSSRPTTSSPCFFYKIPLELREMVFDLAYGDERKITPIFRHVWKYNEKGRKRRKRGRSDFQVKPFPESPLTRFLVSKQYLDEASTVFFRTKSWSLPPFALDFLLHPTSALDHWLGRHVRSLELVDCTHLRALDTKRYRAAFPRLRALHVVATEHLLAIEGDDNVYPTVDEYDSLDLARAESVRALMGLRGLRRIRVTAARNGHLEREAGEKEVLDRNLARLETMAREVVTLSGDTTDDDATAVTIGEALKLDAEGGVPSRWRTYVAVREPPPSPSLSDEEIPVDETEFMKLFFQDPRAMFEWAQTHRK